MFYVKEKISDAVNVTVEITDENVFTRCPGCGDEVNVDLAELFSAKVNVPPKYPFLSTCA